ncbi:MAG: hypothetical protein HOK57_01640 [Planctomycetaceae bacterium]|nr:hypothetical protein [Planctomycetaceae bacterium]MBT4158867.1 hypothetical protein [Planctomycetaceae bacterium]MBT6055681.1 hypothetical protein [Planctomycetaceae bacterium]MBT6458509.1 hypothetical protein [Planctomycetaceae bacterium]MBT6642316.1 hypothetical protein [Planctomycetaceae bacterium]
MGWLWLHGRCRDRLAAIRIRCPVTDGFSAILAAPLGTILLPTPCGVLLSVLFIQQT